MLKFTNATYNWIIEISRGWKYILLLFQLFQLYKDQELDGIRIDTGLKCYFFPPKKEICTLKYLRPRFESYFVV